MWIRFSTTLVLAFIGQAPLVNAQTASDRNVVVREIFLPETGAIEGIWDLPFLGPDPNSTLSSSQVAVQSLRSVAGSLGGPVWALTQSSRAADSGIDGEAIRIGSFTQHPLTAVVSTPNGFEFVAMDELNRPDLRAWGFPSGPFRRWITHPPPPTGKSPLVGFEYISNAGDLNADGWDELFFQDWTLSDEGVAGCIDGQSGLPVWMTYVDGFDGTSRVLPQSNGRSSDLNHDGVPDFLAGFEIVDASFRLRHLIIALSGTDGSVIWKRDLARRGLSRRTRVSPDLDQDGILDLVSLKFPDFRVNNLGSLSALSGADGTTLWTTDLGFIQSLTPSATEWALPGVMAFSFAPDHSRIDLMIPFVADDATRTSTSYVAYLDAVSGANETSIVLSQGDLTPWRSEPFPSDVRPLVAIGDYDADGFEEFATLVPLHAEDSAASTWIPTALAIFGQRTLFGPVDPQIGKTADFQIALPAIPNAPFQLVLSTGFSPRSDKRAYQPDGWQTGLRATGLTQRTANHPGMRGKLDALGQGSVSISIPNKPAFAGITIYARALIADTNQPGSIRTQTSLHTMTIQP